MLITQRLQNVLHNINTAISRRNSDFLTGHQVKLVAVTKNHPVPTIEQAINAGISSVGENRIQEALSKHAMLDQALEWHLIGHLQTNKVKQAIPLFTMIHSVDSERLAIEINRVAQKLNKVQQILLQINVAGEETKFGLPSSKTFELAKIISTLTNVKLCGLMTIAPFYDNAESTRPIFREMYHLYQELAALNLPNTDIKWLSMGMTNDYAVAIEEGANLVRIGTAIFGNREY
ncbi:Pyridoxal phosphate homeostasis protein [bioreactor metagenome]|uniref:Pyridoxal phosphate homeostasis protein n=1 Tax=bioreactor metagenome TaxID=1076179 RepID=A0A644T0L4_9ZZZZ|nr:YggS family pyridoxal phosphate-dependent enzyme [Negativicutes bacterium]